MLAIKYMTLACLHVFGLVLCFHGRLIGSRALDVDVVVSWNIWNHTNEGHHAGNGDSQQCTVDIESIAGVCGFVGVNGVRDGLTERLKGAEDTTRARR